MAVILPPPPRTEDLREIGRWFEAIHKQLSSFGYIAWGVVDKDDADIADISTRPHAGLQDIGEVDATSSDATKDKHVANSDLSQVDSKVSSVGVLISTAQSTADSSGSASSVADSKTVSNSTNLSVTDSKVLSAHP